MAKAKIEFDLNDQDDKLYFKLATKATNMASVIWDFDQWLRDQIKYQGKESLQKVRDVFRGILTDKDILMDELF